MGHVTRTLRLVSGGPADTQAVAASLAGLAVPGDIVLLVGDLGAGKTTFAQGFGAGLGIQESMTSPTFTLVRQYPVHGTGSAGPGAGAIRTLLHADLYRLDRLQEVADLGLGELVEDGGVALVEWGDAAEPLLGRGSLHVRLTASESDEERRLIDLEPADDGWLSRWGAVAEALGGWEMPR
jgi:tRNA threonylcarbamoyladenosine biosynthesis protein TsaE